MNETAKTYDPHPLADIYPLIEGEDFDKLVADIKTHGLREPIVLYEGMILDGRNRHNACIEAGVAVKTRPYDPTVEGPAELFVVRMNSLRRHLTKQDRRESIIKFMKAYPTASDRAIGRLMGVDHKTVGNARKEIEGEIDDFKKRWRILGPMQRQKFVNAYREPLQMLLGGLPKVGNIPQPK